MDIFGRAPQLEKLVNEGELEKSEKKDIEDSLCGGSDDYFACALDLRDVFVKLENRINPPSREQVISEMSDILSDYGVDVDTTERPKREEPTTPVDEGTEPETEPTQEPTEGGKPQQEVFESELFELYENNDYLTPHEVYEILGYPKNIVEDYMITMVLENILEQDVVDGQIAYRPVVPVESEGSEESTVTLFAPELTDYEAQWLDDNPEYVVEIDEENSEVEVTEDGYDKLTNLNLSEEEKTNYMREEAVSKIKDILDNPGPTVELFKTMDRGDIPPDVFQQRLQKELNEDNYLMVREAITDVMEKYEF